MFLPHKILEEKLLRILAEDTGQGDITTALIVPQETTAEAEIIAKEEGTAAGVEEAKILLECLGLTAKNLVEDGDQIKPGHVLIKVSGDARTILTAERTVLNILSRMSGIATKTKILTEKLRAKGLKTKIACTRKTAPGLSYFDKKAVQIGGGDAHRLHLDDMVLIKDNHIRIAGNVNKAVRRAMEKASFSKKIEVEITETEDILPAIEAGVDIVMLDNFSPKQIKNACLILKKSRFYGKILIEASGGITETNLLQYASSGVDIVSMGTLTNSVKTLDISLEITKTNKKKTGN
jgi:nicotinate-nucleotide pyrophosphorylase (carboxylating)